MQGNVQINDVLEQEPVAQGVFKAVYALKKAKDIPALKAVSQNLMHANLSVTDGIYGILLGTDVKGEISELGKKEVSSEASEIAELLTFM